MYLTSIVHKIRYLFLNFLVMVCRLSAIRFFNCNFIFINQKVFKGQMPVHVSLKKKNPNQQVNVFLRFFFAYN